MAGLAGLDQYGVWIASICIVVAMAVLQRCFSTNTHRRRQGQLPPGTLGLPYLGETVQFALFNSSPMGRPLPFLATRLRRYGTVFKTHLLGRPTVVSCDVELNALLLASEEKLVQAYYPPFLARLTGPWLSWRGAQHKRMRELLSSRFSNAATQSLHVEEVQRQAQRTMKSWEGRETVNSQHEIKQFLFGVVLKMAMGLDTDDVAVRDTGLGKQLFEDLNLISDGYTSMPIDVPGTSYHLAIQAYKRMQNVLMEIVRQRREKRNCDAGDSKGDYDLIGRLLQETDEFGEDDNIAVLVFFAMFGGFKTTSVLLSFLMKFLNEDPIVVDELRKEHTNLRASKGKNEMLSWKDYKEMPFSQMVVKEGLRLANVAHCVIRESIQDIQYKGMVIPKGWMVLIDWSMVHLDPIQCPNPPKFDPWRWQGNDNSPALTPFGGGLRRCLGDSVAKFETIMFLHYLVTSYRWTNAKDEKKKDDGSWGLSLPIMTNGMKIKIEPC